MARIKFGTSGWRAILAEEFTIDNVRIVCQAIADYLKEKGAKKVGEAAAQKVADFDPMDAAMSSLNASAERNRKADEEMRRRTADKASGQQSTTAGFGQ